MSRPHFKIGFFGGGGVSWVNRALEGSILILNILRAFSLTFLSKIVGYFNFLSDQWQGIVINLNILSRHERFIQ